MKFTKIILSIILLILIAPAIHARTTNLTEAINMVTAGSYISAGLPNTNFDGASTLEATYDSDTVGNRYMYFLMINLSKYPSFSTITKADITYSYLGVWKSSGVSESASYKIEGFICNDTDGFPAATITWNNYATYITNCSSSAFYSKPQNATDNFWRNLNLTDYLKNYNHDIFVIQVYATSDTTMRGETFHSIFNTYKPKFNITDTNRFRIFPFDAYYDNSINATAIIAGKGTFTATNGEIITNITRDSGILVNITLTSNYGVGYHNLTISNYNVSSDKNAYMTPLGTYWNFTIYKESDQTKFNVNETNSTQLTIVCPSKTITADYNLTANNNKLVLSNNTIDCVWDFVKLDMVYPSAEYFRTFMPSMTTYHIPLYMADLNAETAVQIIFSLNDLTGDYEDGTLEVRKTITGGPISILEQSWDIENKISTYLIKNQLYTLVLKDNEDNERSIGSFFADEAGSKTITVPEINYLIDSGFGDKLNYNFNTQTYNGSLIQLSYSDDENSTTYINFTVYNGSNPTQQLYTTSTTNKGDVTFGWAVANSNKSYLVCFESQTGQVGNFNECKVYGGHEEFGDFSAWSSEEATKFKAWFSLIFILILIMLFNSRITVGLTLATIFLVIFMSIKWLDLGTYWNYAIVSFFGLCAVFVFFIEGDKP